MAIDLEEIFRSLNEILPYLAQLKMRTDFERKRAQIYLQKELERMRVRAGYREEEQFRGRDIGRELEAFGTFLKTGAEGVKGLDQPLLQLLEVLAEAGITGKEIPTVEPGKVGVALAPYTEMMAGQAEALGLPESSIEKMGVATQLKGSPFAMDLLEQQRKTRAGIEEREISKEKTRLGWAELGVKKKGESKKQQDQRLKDWAKKEKIHGERLKSLEDVSDLMEGDPEYDAEKRLFDEAQQEQLNILDQRLGELDKKKCNGIIAKLRTNKINVRVLEKNKEKFMKEENLTETEYNYIRLNL